MVEQLPGNFRQITGTKIYRSSRTEFLDDHNVKILHDKYSIKSLVDLRNVKEMGSYDSAKAISGTWLIDKYYPRYMTSLGNDGNFNHVPINAEETQNEESKYGFHHGVDFIRISAVNMYKQSSWWKRMVFTLFMFLDKYIEMIFKIRSFSLYVLFWLNGNFTLLDSYQALVKYGGRSLCTALRLMTDPSNVPCIVLCFYGKDRTGVLSALVQYICGVDEHTIAKDYAASDGLLEKAGIRYEAMKPWIFYNNTFKRSDYDVMAKLLDYIKKEYGSVGLYLESIGFNNVHQEALRKNVMLHQETGPKNK